MSRLTPLTSSSALLAVCLLAGACQLFSASDSEQDQDMESELRGMVWELERIERPIGKVMFDPEPDQTYWVKFYDSNGLEAQNACNECSGAYEVTDGNALSISPTCTEAACGVPAPNLVYGQALGETTSYATEDGQLRIQFMSGYQEGVLIHESR